MGVGLFWGLLEERLRGEGDPGLEWHGRQAPAPLCRSIPQSLNRMDTIPRPPVVPSAERQFCPLCPFCPRFSGRRKQPEVCGRPFHRDYHIAVPEQARCPVPAAHGRRGVRAVVQLVGVKAVGHGCRFSVSNPWPGWRHRRTITGARQGERAKRLPDLLDTGRRGCDARGIGPSQVRAGSGFGAAKACAARWIGWGTRGRDAGPFGAFHSQRTPGRRPRETAGDPEGAAG